MATVNLKDLPESFDKPAKPDIKLTPLAEGSVKVQKESGWQKARKALFAETIGDSLKYMVSDWIVPSIIEFVAGGTKKLIDYIFYGGSSNTKTNVSKPSYTAYYQSSGTRSRSNDRQVLKGDVEIVAFKTQAEAEKTLMDMQAFIERYGEITYSQFKEFTGREKEIVYTDNYQGWTNLKGCDIHRINDPDFHWGLEMPPLERITE